MKVEVDAAMVVAVALVKAEAVGDHGSGHGWRDGRWPCQPGIGRGQKVSSIRRS